MIADTMAFRRRNIFERKALRLMRGETCAAEHEEAPGRGMYPGGTTSEGLGEYRRDHFGRLREFARHNGFVILPLDAQFVTSSELVILRWLAEAQRQTGLRTCHFRDIGLKATLRYCAGMLRGLGVCLPSQTLHIRTDLDDDLSPPDSILYRAMGQENVCGRERFIEHGVTSGRSGQT